MKIRQSFTLLRQNPFFSVVSIIGTAVSIAFAMVVYMVYDIQTANIRPELHRDRMVYSSYGYSYRKADHSNANTGMSYQAASRVFGDLPGAELVMPLAACISWRQRKPKTVILNLRLSCLIM